MASAHIVDRLSPAFYRSRKKHPRQPVIRFRDWLLAVEEVLEHPLYQSDIPWIAVIDAYYGGLTATEAAAWLHLQRPEVQR
jgi:hypothetical protein